MRTPVTYDLIEKAKTKRGGWTKKQLAAVGVSWPPSQGWKSRIVGGTLDDEGLAQFLTDPRDPLLYENWRGIQERVFNWLCSLDDCPERSHAIQVYRSRLSKGRTE